MLPSPSRRGLDSSRRVLVYALSVLLVAVAILLPVTWSAHPAAWQASQLVRSFTASTASAANGTGAGGAVLPRASGLALAADPTGPPRAQATTGLPAAVQVTSATTYYDVEGADIRALLASLRQRGPSDGHETWAASTSWVFRWTYQPTLDPVCRVQAAHVSLDLAYTYPQWNAPANVAPTVTTAWRGYLARVELHEHGHRDIAEAAANDLARALEALPEQASCDTLAETARTTAADLLARHSQAQVAYDRETGHGATQGAILGQ